MKNSQYINSANINISEMARLTFQEVPPDGEIIHVVTVSCHVEFLKELYRIIGESLVKHIDNTANLSKNKDVN